MSGQQENGARAGVLARVAAAGAWTAPEIVRPYRVEGLLTASERTELFCERVADYRAEVRRITEEEVARETAAVCAAYGVGRLVIPSGLHASRRPAGVEVVTDDGFDAHELDAFGGVLTASTIAIAATGTIVLTAAAEEGRRAITLVPDLHICVVEEDSIVELVPEAMRALAPLIRERRQPVTFISGPSATSDIELRRVEGVHGPRTLVVLVVGSPAPPQLR